MHASETYFVMCSISTGQALYRNIFPTSSQTMPSGAEVSPLDY